MDIYYVSKSDDLGWNWNCPRLRSLQCLVLLWQKQQTCQIQLANPGFISSLVKTDTLLTCGLTKLFTQQTSPFSPAFTHLTWKCRYCLVSNDLLLVAAYALPRFAQLTVTSYYSASSGSHYAVSQITRQIESAHFSESEEKSR